MRGESTDLKGVNKIVYELELEFIIITTNSTKCWWRRTKDVQIKQFIKKITKLSSFINNAINNLTKNQIQKKNTQSQSLI